VREHVARTLGSDESLVSPQVVRPLLSFLPPPSRSVLPASFLSMSGSNSVDVPQQQPAAVPEDPAASLRAAALKTLKSKRRKAPDNSNLSTSLPPRPLAITPSIQLDYGTEEPPRTTTSTSSSTLVVDSAPAVPPQPEPMQVDEDQTREEGEISDSESAPPPKSPSVSRIVSSTSQSAPLKHVQKDRPMPPPIAPPTASVTIKTESSPLISLSSSSGRQATPSGSRYSPAIDYEMYAVDENHIRPGLAS
jgi:hypothetical protein